MATAHHDVAQLLSSIAPESWAVVVYRAVRGDRSGTDPTSENATARYNRGRDRFPDPVWPALYTSLDPGDPQVQVVRHSKSLEDLNDYSRIEIVARLSLVYDISNPDILGWSRDDLTRAVERIDDLEELDRRIKWAYGPPHELAVAAVSLRAEAIIVPSAAIDGALMLVIFPSNLRSDSVIEEHSRQPIHFRQ